MNNKEKSFQFRLFSNKVKNVSLDKKPVASISKRQEKKEAENDEAKELNELKIKSVAVDYFWVIEQSKIPYVILGNNLE